MPARGGTLPRNVRVVWSRVDKPGTNRKTYRGTFGIWILEQWVSVTVAKRALLLESLDLVHGMFCKLHRCFEEHFRSLLGWSWRVGVP